jgi:hypothetical protein
MEEQTPKIGVRVQNKVTILGTTTKLIGWGGGHLYDNVITPTFFTLTINKICVCALRIVRQMATMAMFWGWQSSHINYVFSQSTRSGCKAFSGHLTPAYYIVMFIEVH